MYKYSKYKSKKGDISLLVTLLVCSILLILLAPIAQKLSVESKISRENLMSQQAAQAAKTGLDAWLYNWLEGKIDEKAGSGNQNWPNSDTPPTLDVNGDWLVLDNTAGIQYQVKFQPRSGSIPARIISTGRVNRDGFTIERILEDERKDL
jgi:type II secretory pathway pseudopilin PulG